MLACDCIKMLTNVTPAAQMVAAPISNKAILWNSATLIDIGQTCRDTFVFPEPLPPPPPFAEPFAPRNPPS